MMNRKLFVVIETLLLVLFITATIILAQRWIIDPNKGIIPTAGIKIEGVKKAQVQVGDKKRDDTPTTVDYLTEKEYDVTISKNGRIEWKNKVSVTPEYLTRIFPVLFPTSLNKDIKISEILSIYPFKNHEGFVYTKLGANKNIEVRKYTINENIFGENSEDRKIVEIATTNSQTISILPSQTGDRILLEFNNSKYVLNTDSTLTNIGIPIDIQCNINQLMWSTNERFLVCNQTELIFSYDVSSKQKFIVSQNNTNETYKLLDIDSNKLLLLKNERVKVTSPSGQLTTDTKEEKLLIQSNLDGKNQEILNINEDVSSLKDAYIMTNKQSIILEFEKNIKIINTDKKAFTDLKGDIVYYIDSEEEMVITKSTDKFNIYDLKNEKSSFLDIDTSKVSNLIPYFKNSNFIYTFDGDTKSLFSNYLLGNAEFKIDEGEIIPLVALKKSDYVRFFYAKQNGTTFDIVNIEFEN